MRVVGMVMMVMAVVVRHETVLAGNRSGGSHGRAGPDFWTSSMILRNLLKGWAPLTT